MAVSAAPLVSGTGVVEPKGPVGTLPVCWPGSALLIGIPGRVAGTVPNDG